MNAQLAKPADAALARARELEANPFTVLPPEWAEPVGFFLTCKVAVVRSPSGFCLSLKYWQTKGLTLDDAKACFRRLCDPDVASEIQFESELMARLAGLVAEAIRRRKRIEEQARARQAREADRIVCGLADSFKT